MWLWIYYTVILSLFFSFDLKAPLMVYHARTLILYIIYAIFGTGSRSVECMNGNKFNIEEYVIIAFTVALTMFDMIKFNPLR